MLLEDPTLRKAPRSIVGNPVLEDLNDPDSNQIGKVTDVDALKGRLKIRLDEPRPIPALLKLGVSFDDMILKGSTSNPR